MSSWGCLCRRMFQPWCCGRQASELLSLPPQVYRSELSNEVKREIEVLRLPPREQHVRVAEAMKDRVSGYRLTWLLRRSYLASGYCYNFYHVMLSPYPAKLTSGPWKNMYDRTSGGGGGPNCTQRQTVRPSGKHRRRALCEVYARHGTLSGTVSGGPTRLSKFRLRQTQRCHRRRGGISPGRKIFRDYK